jgi:hypothetical protein
LAASAIARALRRESASLPLIEVADSMQMSTFLSPRGFLLWGGIVLLLLGLIGFVALNDQAQYPAFWLDNGENVAHVGLGIIALAIVLVPGLNTMFAPYYRWIVILLGVVALFFTVYGFLQAGAAAPNTFGLANLENPADNILHLVVGLWALAAAWRVPSMPAMR